MAKTGVGGAGGIDSGNTDPTQPEDQQPSEHQQVETLKEQIIQLEAQLAEAQRTIAHTQRRAEIERELTAARAVDLETATLLTEAAIAEMDQPDVAIAVRELASRKPFLFAAHRAAGPAGVSMSPAPTDDKHHAVNSIAQRARVSGDRAELLRYLRARRTT